MLVFALTIFLGAFLLFEVQPLIGKYILPWFGGGPGVWTTCMLFFQIVLLLGYAYAHGLTRWLRPRQQVVVHLVLLAMAIALLPITPSESWKPSSGGNPTAQILTLLAVTIGLPYFVLSSTGPLLQQWFSRTHPARSPYRLYALSNAGSLLALVSFPFWIEPHFTRKAQAGLWGWGLAAYVLVNAWCTLKLWRSHSPPNESSNPQSTQTPTTPSPQQSNPSNASPSFLQKLLWLLLPACGSTLLLATTNKICQDIAVVPFLWILPLALYLLSFIICFDHRRWYVRPLFTVLLVGAMAAIVWALFKGTDYAIVDQAAVYSLGLFVCCMVCHGELYRLKPEPAYLTEFYLMIAAGGAIGGTFVAVFAPLLFTDYFELHWGLVLCGVLVLLVWVREPGQAGEWRWLAGLLTLLFFVGMDRALATLKLHYPATARNAFNGLRFGAWSFFGLIVVDWLARRRFNTFRHWRLLSCAWFSLALVALGTILWKQANSSGKDKVYTSRNFYGVLVLYEHQKDNQLGHHLLLQHGRITHGLQFVDPQEARWPTSYYGPNSGVQLAINALPQAPRRIGVVGLGTGTTAAFGRAGDYFRIYEINPEVARLATSRFTYLSNCLGQVEVVLGDARLSLEREPPQQFDLIALDAFSSDSIPVHLLTREAFALYHRHLKTNGVVVVNISNHYLDLEPVVANLAQAFEYEMATIDYDEDADEEENWWLYSSTWVALTRGEDIYAVLKPRAEPPSTKKIPLWTDDFASLFQILR